MQHDISFLHTDRAHIPAFASLMEEHAPHLSVHHAVEAELLEQARSKGLGKRLITRIQKTMQAAASTGAKVVVCTCSTIGAAAELAGNKQTFVAMRIDRPMTIQALKTGRRILVAATVDSTLTPTRNLVRDSAANLEISEGAYQIESLLIEPAWSFFEVGDTAHYFQSIHQSLVTRWQAFDAIVLAQASMAGAQPLCVDIKIPLLSSPVSGVQAAINTFNQQKHG